MKTKTPKTGSWTTARGDRVTVNRYGTSVSQKPKRPAVRKRSVGEGSRAHILAEWERQREERFDAAFEEAQRLDVAYESAAKFDDESNAKWIASLGGKCAECDDPAPPGEPLCVACWDAQ